MTISYILLFIGIIFTAIGGYLDITNKPKLWIASKEHYWNDGKVFILLSIFIFLTTY